MSRGRLICITGIDGAGKTTLAQNLVARLANEGLPAEYVYSKYVPMVTRPAIRVANRLFLKRHSITDDYAGYSEHKRTTLKRHSRLGQLYRSASLTEYVAQLWWRVKRPLNAGKVVVLDRYVHDTLITDLAVDFGWDAGTVSERAAALFRRVPRPNVMLFVDLPPAVAMSRKTDVPDVKYLEDRRALYVELAKDMGAITLDGTQTPEMLVDAAARAVLDAVVQ